MRVRGDFGARASSSGLMRECGAPSRFESPDAAGNALTVDAESGACYSNRLFSNPAKERDQS